MKGDERSDRLRLVGEDRGLSSEDGLDTIYIQVPAVRTTSLDHTSRPMTLLRAGPGISGPSRARIR